ncbi:MAG: ATP-dependent Clp protease adapter protein ClpS [Phycisphaerae bacterium]|nr:ATP-dependent Clp protease adapter protein ClpS [Phycisphaerae bacterium]
MRAGSNPVADVSVERPRMTPAPKRYPLYHVVLLDDDDHTYEYVTHMLQSLFGVSEEAAFQLAAEVDASGRAAVATTTREDAEFKQEQIHGFGRDWRLPRSAGSMSCVVEPAPTE